VEGDKAYYLEFKESSARTSYYFRANGHSVRLIYDASLVAEAGYKSPLPVFKNPT